MIDSNYSTNATNYTSDSLNITENYIKRAIFNWTFYEPDGTQIIGYGSNDNQTTWEEVTNGVLHIFSSEGKNISMLAQEETTNESISPIIYSYNVNIIPSAISSLDIDVGADGIYDANYSYELNSTSTPLYYTGNDSSFNLYINDSCNETDCLIPISFVSGSGGTILITEFNSTQDICPVSLNTDYITSNIINLSSTGHINLTDLKFDYHGNKNITASSSDGLNQFNLTLEVFYSPFNVTILPTGIDYWDIGPKIYSWTQTEIAPFGNANGDGNPFWNITRKNSGHSRDIFIRYNDSVDSCVDVWFEGFNNTSGSFFDTSVLSTTSQILVENLTTDYSYNISTLANLSCAAENSTVIIPYFCFHSLCSSCVKTEDWSDDCSLLE